MTLRLAHLAVLHVFGLLALLARSDRAKQAEILLLRHQLVLVQAVHLENMRAEGLKPGQQPVQRRKIGKLAVQHGLNRLHGSGEVLKVQQRLGRENPGNADLVMR